MHVCAMAQSPEEDVDSTDLFYKHLKLNEVVVTGSTGKTELKSASSAISVLSVTEVRNKAWTNAVDLVADVPGVSQITTGAGISKPVIRGLGYNRVLVVHDGIRQEGQQWGDEHGVEIDGSDVSSVEILRGPASLIYGSDALAGVLKYNAAPVTPSGEIHTNVSGEYQSNNGLWSYSIKNQGNRGGAQWKVIYSDKRAHAYKNAVDGYVPGSQYGERSFTAMVGVGRSWGHSRVTASYYHSTPSIIEGERDPHTGELVWGAEKATTYSKIVPFQQIKHVKVTSDNSIILGSDNLDIVLGYQQNRRQEFEESADEYGLFLKLHTLNCNINYNVGRLTEWKLAVGSSGMYQKSVNCGDEFLIPDYNLIDAGVFGVASRSIGEVDLNGGLRWDIRHFSSKAQEADGVLRFAAISRNFTGVSASVGAVCHPNKHFDVRANVARGFRTPNVSELASNGVHEGTLRYEIGDSKLKPEFSWQGDLGLDYTSRVVMLSLNLFASKIRNYIFARRTGEVIEPGKDTYRYTGGDARLMGGEFSIDCHPIHSVHIGTTVSYVDARQSGVPSDEKYLPMVPAARWLTDAKYEILHDGKIINNVFLSVQCDHNFAQSHYYSSGGTETRTPAYTLLNIMTGADIMSKGKRVALIRFGVNNLTNEVYQNHLNRLKYTDVNVVTGKRGVSNMGRNFVMKVELPIVF